MHHLSTRIKIQTKVARTQTLNLFPRYKALSNNGCFSIIDYATTQYFLIIKGGMHTRWQKPALNEHADFLASSFYVSVSMVSNQTTVQVHIEKYNFLITYND